MRRVCLLLALVACSGASGTRTKPPPSGTQPPTPPTGARFLCDRAPFDPRVTWRDCTLTAQPLQQEAHCFLARNTRDGRPHSICAPVADECQRWHDERDRERHDVLGPCARMRAGRTASTDGKPPPHDAQFQCEAAPDPRRRVTWRECKVVDAAPQDTAHCFVARWRAGQHSVCAPTAAECQTWAEARQAERRDVVAPCALTQPAGYWPLP